MKHILLTGGCGFLGTNIALLAIKKGYKVTCFDNFSRKGVEKNELILKHAGVTVLNRDIQDASYWGGSYDYIIHLAAQVGVGVSLEKPLFDCRENIIGTLQILEFARKQGNIPVLYASTNKVFSELTDVQLLEADTRYIPLSPDFKGIDESFPHLGSSHTPYGLSKLTGALYCQEYYATYNVPTVVNHMSCLYGYYQQGMIEQGWVDFILKQIMHGEEITIFGNGKQVRDLLWCEDVAALYLRQIENIDSIAGQEFVIGGGGENTISLIEMIRFVKEVTGKKIKMEYKDWRQADQKLFYADITKATQLLDWKPMVGVEEGIIKMYEKLLKNISYLPLNHNNDLVHNGERLVNKKMTDAQEATIKSLEAKDEDGTITDVEKELLVKLLELDEAEEEVDLETKAVETAQAAVDSSAQKALDDAKAALETANAALKTKTDEVTTAQAAVDAAANN